MKREPHYETIKAPTRTELASLRIMIVIGVLSMLFLFAWLLRPAHVAFAPLYWVLMFTLFFMALKILHEWSHYFYITVPKTPDCERIYTVDVLTTFCPGEPYEMMEETLKAIKAIRYPHESYLCDEANDPYLKKLCEELGVHHVTRKDRENAKAGNINNALKQATGELCVILDPDHVPAPDFLDPIVPHFENPDIGFVQIVQAYKNLHETLVAKGAAQQTFQFYGPMMMTMNHYGTVLAIGANCTFRRAALDSIGGHAPGLAEDMHTAMQLHAKGWLSVYVPRVLARGLVPSSLSGYFKQQLKWARGTFELLITTYPKLFRQFSFRQKMQYATIPFHYFSGFIYLINFLIPILSLLFAVIPLKVDMLHLAYVSMPLVFSTLLIRHFVQRWVMEESERGFHAVGGILQIGTWWINVLGIFYSIIRKEVPYDPTPKDGKEGNVWKLNLPNIMVALLSIGAIIHGLRIDWTPFTLVMALLAAINCGFVAFMLVAGFQTKVRDYRVRSRHFNTAMKGVGAFRSGFWTLRHRLYAGMRRLAVPILLVVMASSFYLYKYPTALKIHDHLRAHPFYTGAYWPGEDHQNLSSLTAMKAFEKEQGTPWGITSFYLAWGKKPEHQLPLDYIEKIYGNGSMPMITWEPWMSGFTDSMTTDTASGKHKVFEAILKGRFDRYLTNFAKQLRNLKRPVFLRFAHEPDNPAYPWSPSGGNSPEEFVEGWKYVHELFDRAGAHNVIWVWNPWSPDAVDAYYPGAAYVDWIGLTALNYNEYNNNGKWKTFDDLYQPFDSTGILDHNLPVMLAEFSSLEERGRQAQWFEEAFETINEKYPIIRALVFFNSRFDKNVPEGGPPADLLDWTIRKPERTVADWDRNFGPQAARTAIVREVPEIDRSPADPEAVAFNVFPGLHAINFRKGREWYGNYDNLARRELIADYLRIKKLGANTVKWYGPGVYDKNVLTVARNREVDIFYSFWIPGHLDFEEGRDRLQDLEEEILSTMEEHLDEKTIVAWNLGNGIWKDLKDNHFKPRLFYQQRAYLDWLKNLVARMRALDPARPITLDVAFEPALAETMAILNNELPQVDAFGILLEERDTLSPETLATLNFPYFYSCISVAQYLALENKNYGAFISSWQDQRTSNYLTFNGITDFRENPKPEYYRLRAVWQDTFYKEFPYEMKIVTPAVPVYHGMQLKYFLAVKKNGSWEMGSREDFPALKFDWYLVKNDGYGNPLSQHHYGDNTSTKIRIPENYKNYEVRLLVKTAKESIALSTALNRPYKVLDVVIPLAQK